MTPDEMMALYLDPGREEEVSALEGKLANDLLNAFWRGYPIENLGRLFASDASSARGTAIFIAGEMGAPCRPFLKEIVAVLDGPASGMRMDAINALSECTTWEDGWAVARIFLALDDPWHGVRFVATRSICVMDYRTLLSGLDYLKTAQPESPFAGVRRSFIGVTRRGGIKALGDLLHHVEPSIRRLGAALALRPRLFIDPELAAIALAAEDNEVVKTVREGLELPTPPWVVRPKTRDG